jgi:hypothetical protein
LKQFDWREKKMLSGGDENTKGRRARANHGANHHVWLITPSSTLMPLFVLSVAEFVRKSAAQSAEPQTPPKVGEKRGFRIIAHFVAQFSL